MAQFDQGGDCDCGLQRVCDCGIGQADGSKPKKKPMGHYDTCREGNCGRCGQALEWCSCPTVIMTNPTRPGGWPGSRDRKPKTQAGSLSEALKAWATLVESGYEVPAAAKTMREAAAYIEGLDK